MHSAERERRGFTVVELVIVLVIMGVLVAVAIPSYLSYRQGAKAKEAVFKLRAMEPEIARYLFEKGRLPDELSDAVDPVPQDPWGNPYEYLNLQNGDPGINGQRRRDKNLNPVNTDYDLYSRGPDGQTAAQFMAQKARDDIVRANDGEFLGVAEDY